MTWTACHHGKPSEQGSGRMASFSLRTERFSTGVVVWSAARESRIVDYFLRQYRGRRSGFPRLMPPAVGSSSDRPSKTRLRSPCDLNQELRSTAFVLVWRSGIEYPAISMITDHFTRRAWTRHNRRLRCLPVLNIVVKHITILSPCVQVDMRGLLSHWRSLSAILTAMRQSEEVPLRRP